MVMRKLLAGALTAGMMLSLIPATAMADTKGWVEDDYGWYYYTSDTEYLKETWQEIDGSWYYFLESGVMARSMWVFIEGRLYHFDKRGHMEKNKWVDCGREIAGYDDDLNPIYEGGSQWRYVGSNGAAYAGWKKINGSWYYFEEDDTGYSSNHGLMATGTKWIDRDLYCFSNNGKMVSGAWFEEDGVWYFPGSDGKVTGGWKKIGSKWYLFNEQFDSIYGMSSGATIDWIDDYNFECWMLDDNGALTSKTGWVQSRDARDQDDSTQCWYYVKAGGKCVSSDWVKSNGKWYYFDMFGRMVADKTGVLINDKAYDFASSGACKNPDSGRKVTGWTAVWDEWDEEYDWAYGDKDGNVYKEKWLSYGGKDYYFYDDGTMYSDIPQILIDGKPYSFAEDGKATDLAGSKTGWIETESGRCYIGSDGKACTGWKQISGKWYYFSEFDGRAYTDGWTMEDGTYTFKDDGEMATGWYKSRDIWYYMDKSGKRYSDRWLSYSGSWYYFAAWGEMIRDCTYLVKGCGYDFDADGKCLNPNKPHVVVI